MTLFKEQPARSCIFFISRLVQRMAADPDCAERNLVGISFDEFKDFCLFLNNLDDFQVSFQPLYFYEFLLNYRTFHTILAPVDNITSVFRLRCVCIHWQTKQFHQKNSHVQLR